MWLLGWGGFPLYSILEVLWAHSRLAWTPQPQWLCLISTYQHLKRSLRLWCCQWISDDRIHVPKNQPAVSYISSQRCFNRWSTESWCAMTPFAALWKAADILLSIRFVISQVTCAPLDLWANLNWIIALHFLDGHNPRRWELFTDSTHECNFGRSNSCQMTLQCTTSCIALTEDITQKCLKVQSWGWSYQRDRGGDCGDSRFSDRIDRFDMFTDVGRMTGHYNSDFSRLS